MKQVAQNYKSGELSVLDVPVPACKPGGVLVRSLFSLISTGTEMMKVSEARLSLLGKAKARPDQVKKLMDSVAQQGAMAAYQKAMSKLDSYTPLGYSLCGVVVQVGAGVEDFHVGQIVAAAGNEFALHAEVNWVPVNLCVPVPDGVAPEHAAFATVGAIAMQGVRQAEPALGETAVVIGLGLIGQLCVRLLAASGVNVYGIDTVAERCRDAEKAGAILAVTPDDAGLAQLERAIGERTGGIGADQVLLAAGGDSNAPVETAARLLRDRGRMVDIGKTKLDLPWNAYYDKELDVRFSRSYGPGRYDPRYELEGIDYPAGYVRWTERRNLSCFLDLLATGSLDVSSLVSSVHPIDTAKEVYDKIAARELSGIGFLLSYPENPELDQRSVQFDAAAEADSEAGAAKGVKGNVKSNVKTLAALPGNLSRARATAPLGRPVRVGFIGAGNYATSMLLPHLGEGTGAELVTVATTTALSGVNAQRKFGFRTATTDTDSLLSDDSLDAIFVVTRHHSHAALVCRALEAGKAVFVEKPLCLSEAQLAQILAVIERTGNDRLMVGFNRRFAPLFTQMQDAFGPVRGPVTARYLINAGKLGTGSWYLNADMEGSRFVGEGGHFIDTIAAFVGSDAVSVHAMPTAEDGVHATITFANSSIGIIDYLTDGNAKYPKETLDVTGGGRNARLDNFAKMGVWAPSGKTAKRSLTGTDKGQRAQVAAFLDSVRNGTAMPISLSSIVATTRATIAAGTSATTGEVVRW